MKNLINTAKQSAENSYSPYSNFKVGACLLCKDGTTYTGANIENSSYPLCMCAERNAIYKAVLDGKKDFSAIAVVGGFGVDGENENTPSCSEIDFSKPCYPCGACLQVMAEFCDSNFKVILVDGDRVLELKLSDLLPYCFSLAD
jgi:cytidine deaminase